MSAAEARITVRDLDMRHGERVIQRDLNFTIGAGEIFVIMGGSGCGKSWTAEPETRDRTMRRVGVLYQSGALWSSLTLAENVALPLGEYTSLTAPRGAGDGGTNLG